MDLPKEVDDRLPTGGWRCSWTFDNAFLCLTEGALDEVLEVINLNDLVVRCIGSCTTGLYIRMTAVAGSRAVSRLFV
jgi:hypothetical protein